MEKKFKLPKEFGEKWLTALRSGEYKQATEILAKFNEEEDEKCKYCCLGVGCKIAGIPDEHMYTKGDPDDLRESESDFGVHIPELFHDSKFTYKVMNMNDREGKTFPEIADWIEENVEFV